MKQQGNNNHKTRTYTVFLLISNNINQNKTINTAFKQKVFTTSQTYIHTLYL